MSCLQITIADSGLQEILVEGNGIKVIRRRETFDDLLRQERDV